MIGEVSLVLSFLVPILFVSISIKLKKKYGKKEKPIEKEILENLPPAIAGYLVSGYVDIREIQATILDLAIRGYIKINEEGKEVEFIKMKDEKGLAEFEAKIMEILFRKGEKVKVSRLSAFNYYLPAIKHLVEKEAIRRGLYDQEAHKMAYKYFIKITIPISIIEFLLLLSATFFSKIDPPIKIFFIPLSFLVVAFIIMLGYCFFRLLKRKTPLGIAQENRYKELYVWLKNYPLKEGRLYDEFLQYSVAFGVIDIWLKKLENMRGEEKKRSIFEDINLMQYIINKSRKKEKNNKKK